MTLVLTGFALGLLLAAQVGPVTLLIVRSVLRGGRALAVGLAMAGAVAAVDVLYATLGLVGVGRLLDVSFPAAAPAAARGSAAGAAALIAGVALRTSGWYCGFSTAVTLVRRRLGERLLRAVDVLSGLGLVGFRTVVAYRAAADR